MRAGRYRNSMVKVTRPGALAVRCRRPSCSCMMRRETLRPMPEPSVLVVKKGVKMFSAVSGGMVEK